MVRLATLSWRTSERANSGCILHCNSLPPTLARKWNDMDILARLLELRRREHQCTVDLLEALVECDRARAYLDHAYESMWKFLTEALRYSNGAASRRYKALKCARRFPVVIEWLRAERVTLCSLEAIAPLLDELDDEQALLDRIEGKSQAEVQRIVAQARPVSERREVVKTEFVQKKVVAPTELFATQDEDGATAAASPLPSLASSPPHGEPSSAPPSPARPSPVSPPPPEERVRVTLSLTPEEFEWVERARMLASRRPGRAPSVHEIVVEAARFYVEKKAPKVRASKASKSDAETSDASTAELSSETVGGLAAGPAAHLAPDSPDGQTPQTPKNRHIPVAIRDDVHLRDGEQCTFVGSNGRRCQARFHLNVDHVAPFAFGGSHAPENLRLLCGAHNRQRADRTFGERRGRTGSGAERHVDVARE